MSRLRAHDMSDEMTEDYSSIRRGIEKVLSSLPNPRSYQNLFTYGRTIISDRSIALELSLAVGDPEWVYDAYRADSAIQFVIDRLESEAPNGMAHWLYRPGGPIFHLHPSTHFVEEQQQLLMEFTIDANPQPNAIEARWVAANTETIVIVMSEPSPKTPDQRKYQLKPFKVSSTEPVDSVSLEIQFRLSDGRHGGRWIWPVQTHEKGHWIVDNHLGSDVHQPKIEDTW